MKRRFLLFCLVLWAGLLAVQAQNLWQLARYDAHNSQLQGHATQILQDRSGLIWVATWNGLYRFDGYEFQQFRPQAGDGCSMSSDRLRDICLADNGDLFCRADDGLYRFDIGTYQFRDLSSDSEREEARRQFRQGSDRGRFNGSFIDFVDPQGLEWQLRDNALYCMSRIEQPQTALPMGQPAMVRATMRDADGRIWLTTKQDASVRLLDAEARPLGYLGPSGRLQPSPVSFGAPVYCITQTRRGDIWLGSKPKGLFRLRETAGGRFDVLHIEGLACQDVYDIAEDGQGRLWLATLGGGLAVVEQPGASRPTVVNRLQGYPREKCQNVRFIHITADDILLATTTEGLLVASLGHRLDDIVFRRHQREADRPGSLSSNATMDIAQMADGTLFVSTETGGVCQIMSQDLTADTLLFRHYDTRSGLPTNLIVSMAPAGGRLLLAGNTQLMMLDPWQGRVESFGSHFFHHDYYFSEAQPLRLADGRWLIATQEDAFLLEERLMQKNVYQPPLVLTGIAIQNGKRDLAVDDADTLRLSPRERSLTIHFAALDYVNPQAVCYQFRLGRDSVSWNSIGHNHSVTLLDLAPGTYELSLRSTNADGIWADNERTLTIIAMPTFWETPWAVLLFVAIGLMLLAAVAYTYLYIRRIERQRQDTLEKYLALLSSGEAQPSRPVAPAGEAESAFMQQVMDYVEQNLGNSDADVGQMAEACAVSRSVLQRKLKQLVGLTPADFLREARLKRACQLLTQTQLTVAEVAYRCGFSDPKYFSRCFRQSQGMSPSEYKER